MASDRKWRIIETSKKYFEAKVDKYEVKCYKLIPDNFGTFKCASRPRLYLFNEKRIVFKIIKKNFK